jgi:hypothetical protein
MGLLWQEASCIARSRNCTIESAFFVLPWPEGAGKTASSGLAEEVGIVSMLHEGLSLNDTAGAASARRMACSTTSSILVLL